MSQQEGNRHNPFGNHAEQIDTANANGPPVVEVVSPQGEIVAAGAVGAAAGAVAGLTRGASKRENGLQKDFTTKNPMLPPVSPVGTEFSMSSEPSGPPAQTPGGAAIAAAGGPANSTVHRVQLDFKPSMEDELELRAGQLIRLLHEYDDGWVSVLSLLYYAISSNNIRLFAFDLIAPLKASSPELVYLSAPSSLVLSRMVLVVHHPACAVLASLALCRPA